jgi:hypothetical protein
VGVTAVPRQRAGFPPRDANRRILYARDLLGVVLAGVVAGVVVLLLFDAIFALLGLGDFGRVNGWLAAVLPAMLLIEEFRAWHGVRGRLLVAAAAAAVGAGAGLGAAGLADGLPGDLPALATGAVGAATLAVVYALLWYYGIRAAGGRTGEDTHEKPVR